jgi:hypothetical protein
MIKCGVSRMTEHRNRDVTVRTCDGGIPSVTNVTHPFRGVTDVTVPGPVTDHGENAHG